MAENCLGISIPLELQQFKKNTLSQNDDDDIKPTICRNDFGVKVVRDKDGNPTHAEYYSDSGELLKKIFYKNSSISAIEHYRNYMLSSKEEYLNGLIYRELAFNSSCEIVSSLNYEYNNKNYISKIRKIIKGNCSEVEYEYDELDRIKSVVLKFNGETVSEQKYRYDILDRIIEYQDRNQIIKVHKINQYNNLINYTITDKLGNTISIINKFLFKEYIGTEIDLNGHKTIVNDECYVDNVILKKPIASKNVLDNTISVEHKPSDKNFPNRLTKRYSNKDIIEKIIGDKMNIKQQPLPISMRKLLLLNNV